MSLLPPMFTWSVRLVRSCVKQEVIYMMDCLEIGRKILQNESEQGASMTDREIMRQALDHLVRLADDLRRIPSDIAKTIAALEAALAQPEQKLIGWKDGEPQYVAQPDPVAVWELTEGGWDTIADADWMETLPIGTKLYTTPHSAKGSADSAEGFGKPEQNHLSDAMSVLADVNADLIAEAKLAQPEQEPVAWLVSDAQGRYATIRDPAPYGEEVYEPLYTAPPKRWVGLTDAEIDECNKLGLRDDVYKAIEAALRSKNI